MAIEEAVPFKLPPMSPRTAYTNTVPFTERDGTNFIRTQEQIINHLNKIIGMVNQSESALYTAVRDDLIETRTQVENTLESFSTLTQQQLEEQSTDIENQLATQNALITQKIQEIVDGSVELNDEIAEELIKTPSLTQGALDVRYQLKGAYQPDGTVSDAAVSNLLDDAESPSATLKSARDVVSSGVSPRIVHKFGHTDSTGYYNFVKMDTMGKFIPGMVGKEFATSPRPALTDFKTVEAASHELGVSLISNGSGWNTTTGEIRGPNIKDGVAYGELNTSSIQSQAAIVYCDDGKFRYYEYQDGTRAAHIIADGGLHSWSWGPALVMNGQPFLFETRSHWNTLGLVKTARVVFGSDIDGNVLLLHIYGATNTYGATPGEARQLALALGFHTGVLLDGGGSATAIWEGNIYHNSADSTQRPLPEYITLNAPRGSSDDTGSIEVPLAPNFTGSIRARRCNGVITVEGVAQGPVGATNTALTETGAWPPFIREQRAAGSVRFSGGKSGTAAIRNELYVASNEAAANPDLYVTFPARY